MLCRVVGMTRQNYYQRRSARESLSVDERFVLELVGRERARQPMLGGRKLLHCLSGDLRSAEVRIGRDRFFELLGRNGLLIARRRGAARTTDSRHGFSTHPNLAKDFSPSAPHQLLVGDITYIRTLEGFMYLCLVMDAFSRTIVGFDSSDTLEMEGALRALSMAIGQLPRGAQAMHHSDRGVQYCCGAYVAVLREAGMAISMTEENHCYENAKAERLNGTLKREYGLGATFADKAAVVPAVREAVTLYNHHRPHAALDYRTPMQVHRAVAAAPGSAAAALALRARSAAADPGAGQ